jgi:hypothetical protein
VIGTNADSKSDRNRPTIFTLSPMMPVQVTGLAHAEETFDTVPANILNLQVSRVGNTAGQIFQQTPSPFLPDWSLLMLNLPVHGEQHGCNDQGAPSSHSEEELSRVYDMLYSAEQAGLGHEQVRKIFSTLPESMKLEFNYSNWRYCNAGARLQFRAIEKRHPLLTAVEPDDLNCIKS